MEKARKMLCLIMATVTALSMSVSASAESVTDDSVLAAETGVAAEPDDDGYVLVSAEEVTLEDGQIVEVKMYLEDGIETYEDKKGSKPYRCEAKFMEGGKAEVVLWVKGTFSWDSKNNTASVTDVDSDYSINNTMYKYDSIEKKNGSDVGGLFFGKRYAYVEIKLTLLNSINKKMDYKLSFDVNVNGDTHYTTGTTSAEVTVT